MAVNPLALVSLAVAFSVAAVGTYVFFRDPRGSLNRVYLWLSLLLFFWNFFQFVYRSVLTYEIAYAWLKAAVFAAPLVAAALLHFALRFADSKVLGHWWFYVALYGPSALICALFSFTDLLIGGPVKVGGWYDTYATGNRSLLVPAMAWLLAVSLVAVVRLFAVSAPRSRATPLRRRQARLVSIGIGVMFAVTITTELILRAAGLQPVFVGTWGAGVIALLIGYAMIKYELFTLNPATAAESIVSTMTDSLVIADPDARILNANRATVEMLGYTSADVRGEPVAMLFGDGGRQQDLTYPTAEDSPAASRETTFVARNRRAIPVLLSRSPIFSKTGMFAGSVYVAKDITDLKRLEDELRTANEDLEARVRERTAELADANEDLVAEIRERERIQAQLREKDLAIRKAYVDVIGAVTGGRLVLVTPEELQAALGRPATPAGSLDSFEKLADARAAIAMAIRAEFPDLRDPDEYIVAVGEALTNAVKHASGGTYRLYRAGTAAQIAITDEGPGIDFETLPKATLLAGFSTKCSMGLGFSIMLELCERVLLSTERGRTTVVLEIREARSREPRPHTDRGSPVTRA